VRVCAQQVAALCEPSAIEVPPYPVVDFVSSVVGLRPNGCTVSTVERDLVERPKATDEKY